MRNKGRCSGSRLTLPGRVALERLRFARADGSGVIPADELIDRAGRAVSLGVVQLSCRLSLDAHSFDRAAGNLKAAAGLSLGAESLRGLVEGEGKLVVHAQHHEQLEFDWRARDCLTANPQGEPVSRAYLSTDGVMAPTVTQAEKDKRRAGALQRRRRLRQERRDQPRRPPPRPLPAARAGADQKYKEFKIVTLYDQARERRAVCATRQDHRHAGRLMRRMAAAVGLREAQEKVGLMDGADGAASQTRANVPCLDSLGLDFHHLAGHVEQVRVEVFGDQSPQGLAWAGEALHTVKHEGYEPFWRRLMELRGQTRSPGKRARIDGLLRYAGERRAMLDYPRHRQRGWDIGSGPVESMCKALTGRLKGRGMRWDADNAEAMMALEALMQSHQWEKWWANRCNSWN